MTVHVSRLQANGIGESVRIQADIAVLRGTLFRASGTPKAAVVLHPAVGVPARFYHDFATWLTEQGFACLTYDYRGYGESRAESSKHYSPSLVDWGLRDQQSAQHWLQKEYPGTPIWIIGHSLGGLMVPFHSNADRVAKLISVASGPVHLSDHSPLIRLGAHLLWFGIGPASVKLLGKLPGRLIGSSGDIPARVYWQWRRWCTSYGFHLGDVGRTLPAPDFGAFKGDARFVAIADDGLVPTAAVWRLMQFYPEAFKQQHVVKPEKHGLDRVGHIALFHRSCSAAWPEILG